MQDCWAPFKLLFVFQIAFVNWDSLLFESNINDG
jgi:hypothetical protein